MFDPTSRYANLKRATRTTPDGRLLQYVRRRFLPDGSSQPLLRMVTVEDGDRLDLVASRTIGEPTQFWRVADANNAMDPLDLVEEPGRRIRVTVPQP